jgi:hypothetical protein
MRALVFASLALVALSSSACDSRDPAPTPNDVAPAWRASRVVVALVVDQLALWHVEERFPHLPETGGFKRLRRESAFAELRYGHLQTSTAIGHSTLFTGAPPHLTRVVANEVLDGDGSDRAIVKDDATRLVGGDGPLARAGASLAILPPDVDTLADALRQQRPDVTITCLSMKDRGAVFACGRSPDAVAWYDPTYGGLVTSTAFGPSPTWRRALMPFGTEGAAEEYQAVTWNPLDVTWLEARGVWPARDVGQGNYAGLGSGFPHELWRTERPAKAMLATPQADLLLADAALAVLDELPEDRDAFLAVSFSAHDYVMHVFGPDTPEAWDELLRLDAQLGRLLDHLEELYGPDGYSVVLSADHGGPRSPEGQTSCDPADRFERPCGPATRIFTRELVSASRTAAERAAGPGVWVRGVVEPFVHLTDAARSLSPEKREALVAEIRTSLLHHPGIEEVVDVVAMRQAECPPYSDDSRPALVCRSLPRPSSGNVPGDLLLIPRSTAFFDSGYVEGDGCNHGSPALFDRTVPIFARGFERRAEDGADFRARRRVDPRAYSATLASLLEIEPPRGAQGGEILSVP